SRSRGRPGNSARPGCAAVISGGFKVVVPEVDIDRVGGSSLRAPQLARRKADRIQVLRFLAETLDEAVVEDMHAVVAHDGALFTARIAWQAGVAQRVDIARAHPLALV